jgi:death-on-curing protein
MRYLSPDEVLAIHEEMINIFGGSHGIKDFGLLYSAIYRPQASFAGEDFYPSVFEKGAALVHSLLLNHPFIDGNKRTAYTSVARYLYMNGYLLEASSSQIISFTKTIENKKLNIEKIARWLKKHSKKQKELQPKERNVPSNQTQIKKSQTKLVENTQWHWGHSLLEWQFCYMEAYLVMRYSFCQNFFLQ